MSGALTLERGIDPVPERTRAGKYPMRLMSVGESFFVAGEEANFESIRQSAYRWGKRHGRTFRTARVAGGVRVWRLT